MRYAIYPNTPFHYDCKLVSAIKTTVEYSAIWSAILKFRLISSSCRNQAVVTFFQEKWLCLSHQATVSVGCFKWKTRRYHDCWYKCWVLITSIIQLSQNETYTCINRHTHIHADTHKHLYYNFSIVPFITNYFLISHALLASVCHSYVTCTIVCCIATEWSNSQLHCVYIKQHFLAGLKGWHEDSPENTIVPLLALSQMSPAPGADEAWIKCIFSGFFESLK